MSQLEDFRQQVLAARLAQLETSAFRTWLRQYDATIEHARERLSKPATRGPAHDDPQQHGERAEARVPLRKRNGR